MNSVNFVKFCMISVNFVMFYKIDLFIYLYLLCSEMFNVYINLNVFSIC